MSQTDLVRFRRMCTQFRWLTVFMVVGVGAVLGLMYVVAPAAMLIQGREAPSARSWLAETVWAWPGILYLFAVWSIGAAMGQLAKGRLIQPTLARALRRVGLALGFGGLLTVFGVTNISGLIGGQRAGWAYFDVASMTLGMIGGALFLLGRVIDQADRAQAELDEMI